MIYDHQFGYLQIGSKNNFGMLSINRYLGAVTCRLQQRAKLDT